MPVVISVENLSKSYRLGQIGSGTLTNDLKLWWAKMRGQANPLLKIGQEDHLHRDGEQVWALRDVSFTVEQGEVLGIIGRNGAGKSTLLKILSRVTAPTSGQVKVKGRIASLLEVGTGFHPELTGRENIYLNGAILGMSKQEVRRKFDEIVDFAEVEKFIDTPVKRYSSGMYVRLAFAVAAHLEPEILLVDEVLAVGDAEFQKKCLGKMGDVAKQGRTVLFVSHNMGAISSLCQKTILIHNGCINVKGSTREVVQKYLLLNGDNSGEVTFPYSGNSIIKKITLRNNKNLVTNNFYMGEGLIINLELDAHVLIRRPSICFYIRTSTGIPVWHSLSEDSGSSIENLSGRHIVEIKIPELLLYPGSYSLSVWLGDSLGAGIDHLRDSIILQVSESPKFSRRNLSWEYGLVYCKAEWNLV